MQKKAVALAVGALFAAPAVQAQLTMGNETTGTVQVYGKLYPQYGSAKGQGSSQVGTQVSTLVSPTGIYTQAQATPPATAPAGSPGFVAAEGRVPDHGQRWAVDSQNSYLGFRGERNLGGGLKGIWQIEQSIALDTGTGTFSNRNSFAGLSHGTFGTIKLGNMDTIYKEYGDTFSMFGIASGNFISASNVLSNIGLGNSAVSRFHERRANSIQYQTGEFAGFQAGVQYGPDENRGNPGVGLNANVWSYGVKWDSQMFYASVHQEVHNDALGASNNMFGANTGAANGTFATSSSGVTTFTPAANARSRDMATRGSGEVRFSGPFAGRITVDVARLHYVESGQVADGKFLEYKKVNWALGAEAGTGPWRFATQYVRAGAGNCKLTGTGTIADCDATGLQAWMVSFGARYRFDRQTFVYVIGSKLSNGPSARMDNWANADPNRGEDIKQAAVGISYSF